MYARSSPSIFRIWWKIVLNFQQINENACVVHMVIILSLKMVMQMTSNPSNSFSSIFSAGHCLWNSVEMTLCVTHARTHTPSALYCLMFLLCISFWNADISDDHSIRFWIFGWTNRILGGATFCVPATLVSSSWGKRQKKKNRTTLITAKKEGDDED